jgi:hypothetical protein
MQDLFVFGGVELLGAIALIGLNIARKRGLIPEIPAGIVAVLVLLFITACAGLGAFAASYNRSQMRGELILPLLLTQAIALACWIYQIVVWLPVLRAPDTSGVRRVTLGIGIAFAGFVALLHGLCAVSSL